MDQRLKKLNNRIAGLRQAYDQLENTAEAMLAQQAEHFGGAEAYLGMLKSVACDQNESMDARFACSFAQFGVFRLLLNESEREHADILLGIDPNEPSAP